MNNIIKYKSTANICEVMEGVIKSKYGIVLIMDQNDNLIATMTDGDMRCAVLSKIDMREPVLKLINNQKKLPFKSPITAKIGASKKDLLDLMNKYRINHIPLLNKDNKVINLTVREELENINVKLSSAIIMAGGRGERLRPLTDKIPKPMLPIKNKPLLEHIILMLKDAGISEIQITLRYKSEYITDYFKNGEKFGVKIKYLSEKKPLGTAGFLKLIKLNHSTLVINGDVLTNLNFNSLYLYHLRNKAAMTVAVHPHLINVPYGVLNMKGDIPFGPSYKCMEVVSLEEKPTLQLFVNAGVYVLEPDILKFLPETEYFNMTDVINEIVNNRMRVASFPLYGYWKDIGNIDDYEKVPNDIKNVCFRIETFKDD